MNKHEFLALLQNRVSVRSFKKDPVSEEDIDYIIDCGRSAPTGKNRQPLMFVVLKSDEVRKEYSDLLARTLGRAIDAYYQAPLIILVFGKETSTYVQDGSAAIQNMLLGIEALGLSACWIHASTDFFSTDEGKEFQVEKLGVGLEYHGLEGIALGYLEGERPKPKERLEEVKKL